MYLTRVKSWEYFCTLNISLESTFHWLSNGILKFEVDVGVYELYVTMYQSLRAQIVSNSNVSSILRDVNFVAMATIEMLLAVHLFSVVWANFLGASLLANV